MRTSLPEPASKVSPALDAPKVLVESVRGAATLGASVGVGMAAYVRATHHLMRGRLSPGWIPAVSALPALGVGASAVSDALSAQILGAPTDAEGRSCALLRWVSPTFNGVSAAMWRYAPWVKPRPGSAQDMAAQVAVAAAGGALAYSTREWLAQRAVAGRRKPLPRRAGAQVDTADRVLARTATQIGSTALRVQALAQPHRAAQLYLPMLFAASVPYGWREELAQQLAQARQRR
jgi:hypothetical protein